MLAKYRKYVINDFKLPKIVVQSPYFEEQYELLGDYGFKDTFDTVERYIDNFGNVELFFEEVSLLSNKMFNFINERYDGFQVTTPNKKYYDAAKYEFNGTLINPNADSRSFIRIDIKRACFNVLKELTPLIDDFATYEEFVHRFSEFDEPVRDYVAASKRIRSYIFGCIQKNIIVHLEKDIIGGLINKIGLDVVFKDCDEVVYNYTDDNLAVIQEVINGHKLKHILRIEEFEINKLDYGYVECHNDCVVFKGVPAHYFCEQYARYYNKPIIDDYRIFNFEHEPCMRLPCQN